MADWRERQQSQKKELSPERCSGVKNKSTDGCTVFATGSCKMIKESSLSIPWFQDKESIVTLILTCTKSKTRMESSDSSSKIQPKISPASYCSKILKYGIPDSCFRNLKN